MPEAKTLVQPDRGMVGRIADPPTISRKLACSQRSISSGSAAWL
jgi:hypothetical protein